MDNLLIITMWFLLIWNLSSKFITQNVKTIHTASNVNEFVETVETGINVITWTEVVQMDVTEDHMASTVLQVWLNGTWMLRLCLFSKKKIENIVNKTALVKEVYLIKWPNTKSKYSQNSFVYFYCFNFLWVQYTTSFSVGIFFFFCSQFIICNTI